MVNESPESLLRWIPLLPLLAAAVHGVMIGLVRRPHAARGRDRALVRLRRRSRS